ncbi:uncharacterized protein [Miscanthus floridulus]|uniref:uncharacterized protein n=1 Tax=Miscanthus floridulus TaxID=154761 RepID=UPI003457637A
MTTHIKSINQKIWLVVEKKFEVVDLEAPTAAEEEKLQNNDIALSAIHDAISQDVFEQIKNLEMAHDAWKKLEESFEGTQAVKGAKAYILKEKFASFKMKEDETVPKMFNRLQVLVNDLKALGENVEDKDFSHKFLRCLPSRFGMLVTLLVRSGLDTMTPNQILGDVVTNDTYRDDKEEMEKKDEKNKSVAFKATSSSKRKGKAKQEESCDDDSSNACEDEDEEMAIFVKRFGKFMKKKGYHARREKSSSKGKDEPRRCFKCNSKDHLIADCPYNSDNDDDKKGKKKKKDKNESTHKKKKNYSHIVTWDSDASTSDEDDSDDERKTSSKKKAIASIAINDKPSLFDTPSTCFMAKANKVQSDDESDSDSDNDDEPTKDELMDMLDDARDHFDIKRKECKEL